MGLRITKLTPMQGFCAETGGCRDPVHGDLPRGSRLDHPHDHRRHRRRRRRPTRLRGALERGKLDRLRVGDHDPGLSRRRCTDLVGSPLLFASPRAYERAANFLRPFAFQLRRLLALSRWRLGNGLCGGLRQRDRRHSLGESVAPEWPRIIRLEESHRVQDKAEVPVTGYGNNGMDDYLFGGC
jgi:hypothetical protein